MIITSLESLEWESAILLVIFIASPIVNASKENQTYIWLKIEKMSSLTVVLSRITPASLLCYKWLTKLQL